VSFWTIDGATLATTIEQIQPEKSQKFLAVLTGATIVVAATAITQDWLAPAGYLVHPLQKASGPFDRSFLQFPLLDRNTSIHIIVEESNNGLGICPQLRRHAYAVV
jgi:hypothetical protein